MEVKEIAMRKLKQLLIFVVVFGFLFSYGLVCVGFSIGDYITTKKISLDVFKQFLDMDSYENIIALYLYAPFLYLAISIYKKRKHNFDNAEIIMKHLTMFKVSILGIVFGIILLCVIAAFSREAGMIFFAPIPYIVPFIGLFIGKMIGRIVAKLD